MSHARSILADGEIRVNPRHKVFQYGQRHARCCAQPALFKLFDRRAQSITCGDHWCYGRTHARCGKPR